MPQAKTLDDTLAEEWKAISAKYAVDDETPPIPAEEPAPEPAEAPAEGETGGEPQQEPPRDESGRFAKPANANAQEKPEKTVGKEGKRPGESVRPEPEPGAAEHVPLRDLNRPPPSWKPTIRAEWSKLAEPVRAEILRRENDFARFQQESAPDAQFGRSLRQTIEPYRMLIEAEGGTPERAVSDLLRTAAIFRVGTPQQKYQAIGQIAQQFGLDLSVFSQQAPPNGGQPAGGAPQQFLDPRVDQLLAHQRQQEAARAQREQTELETTVTSWMDQIDEKGNSKYPYHGDVIAVMSSLIPQIRAAKPHLTTAQILEEGYQRAIWAHPEVRTLLQREAASASDAERRSANQTRVRDARRAASVNVPRRASLPSAGKPGRIEDTIADKARELGLIST